VVELKNVQKSFGDNIVLKGISAKFEAGKVNMIIGKSGSGKSVLMKAMVGLLSLDKGDIFYDGREFSRLSYKEKVGIRKEIGMLFQYSALFGSMTVEENVVFPLNMFSDFSRSEKLDRVADALKRVGLADTQKMFPSEISGGMKKRVGIARAIVLNPDYLYCDEPNSGLDPETSIRIDELIQEITYENNTVTIMNTHDMNSIMGIGDYVLFISDGEKAWEGDREDIMETDNERLNNFVFAGKLMRRVKGLK